MEKFLMVVIVTCSIILTFLFLILGLTYSGWFLIAAIIMFMFARLALLDMLH